jgi:hypothetical protein
MAQRRSSNKKSANTEPNEGTVQTEEAPVTETTTENTNETPTEASKPEAEVDLTAFNKAVAEALEASDTSTGEVPEANLEAVKAAYRALDGAKAKNAAKKAVNEAMKDAMNSDNLPQARANLMISENALVAGGGGGGGQKAPADPTEAFVQRVATIHLAYGLVTAHVPEGVDEGWQQKVTELVESSNDTANSYLQWTTSPEDTRGDEPEASPVVKNAVKLSQGKQAKAGTSRSGGSFTGERRDIGVHIRNAFEGKDKGTFLSIAEIRNTPSDEYSTGEGSEAVFEAPSAGAISARLDEKEGKKSSMRKFGIIPDTQNGKKGAYLGDPEE